MIDSFQYTGLMMIDHPFLLSVMQLKRIEQLRQLRKFTIDRL